MPSLFILQTALCCISAILVGYFDIRYRRIPNKLVLPLLLGGLLLGFVFAGTAGLVASVQGLLLGFGLMFVLHMFGALGAGDVKLFAALGAVLGVQLVLPTFVIVVLLGGVLAVGSMLYVGTTRVTGERVLLIFNGLLMGSVPRFPVPDDKRQTLPYGVAITVGSLLSLVWHNL